MGGDAVCDTASNLSLDGVAYLVTGDCPEMTWYEAMEFCQRAGMVAVGFDSSRTDDEIEGVMEILEQPNFQVDTFWTSGVVDHPVNEK